MTVQELLNKEKGKYSNYEMHYKQYAKYIPFTFMNGRRNNEMIVVDYFYLDEETQSFDVKLNFKGKIKEHTLIIVWDKVNA